jgi:hypothetical protein
VAGVGEDGDVTDNERAETTGTDEGWVVWRQGDDGNPFEVGRLSSRAEADELASALEARGHRQTYWVTSMTRPAPPGHTGR